MYREPPVIPTDSPLDPDSFNKIINFYKEQYPIRNGCFIDTVLHAYPYLINQKVLHNVIESCLNPDYNELNPAYPRHHKENENYRRVERFGLNVFEMYLKALRDPHHLKTTIPLIMSKLSHKNEAIRTSASQYIGILTRDSSKRFLEMINETLPTLYDLLEDSNPGVRSIALGILRSVIESMTDLIDQAGIDKIRATLSDEETSVKLAALRTYTSAIEYAPQFIDQSGIDKVMELQSISPMEHAAVFAFEAALEKFPDLITATGIENIILAYIETNSWPYLADEAIKCAIRKFPKLFISVLPKVFEFYANADPKSMTLQNVIKITWWAGEVIPPHFFPQLLEKIPEWVIEMIRERYIRENPALALKFKK